VSVEGIRIWKEMAMAHL